MPPLQQANSTDPGESDFAKMVRLAATGDPAAQAQLCSIYENDVRILARVHLGTWLRPHLDSLDINQTVHKSILNGLMNCKLVVTDPEKLVALACLIARRKIAKKWRKHRRQIRLTTPQNNETHDWLESLLPATDDVSKNRSAIEWIEEISLRLTTTERSLFELRLSGLTSDQIATELGIDPVAVRVRWSRLCAKLRSSMAP